MPSITFFFHLGYPENPIKLHSICEVNYEKVGCFKEDINNRTLSQELFQDRMSSDPNYSGQRVDWANYNTYLKRWTVYKIKYFNNFIVFAINWKYGHDHRRDAIKLNTEFSELYFIIFTSAHTCSLRVCVWARYIFSNFKFVCHVKTRSHSNFLKRS